MNIIEYLNMDAYPTCKADSTGIKDNNSSITFSELVKKASALGKFIAVKGMINEGIGVLAEHNKNTVLLFLGILMSGNYYIPIAPDITKERLQKIQYLSGMRFLLGESSEERKTELKSDCRIELISSNAWYQTDVNPSDLKWLKAIRKRLPESAPMYIIFTSGSTGEPKGIVKTHVGMISFMEAYHCEFNFRKEDVIGNQTPFYFDASSKDIYLACKKRCSMVILPSRLFVMPIRLVEYLNEEHVSIIQWVPSALAILSKLRVFDTIIPHYLRMVFFVGEVFPTKQLMIWMKHMKDTVFINLYGSSEICGICTYYRIQEDLSEDSVIPIGYPMKNSEIFLVHNNEVISEPEKTGEIYIKSDALALGYCGNEKKTREIFIERPLPQLPAGRYYKSGDLAYFNHLGAFVFKSRRDYQIKHMGHRIELGEIEHFVCKLGQVHNAGCIYESNKIILFYEGEEEKSKLLSELKGDLPSYMIPNKVIRLNPIPLNANGKVNRLELKNYYRNK